MARLGEQAIKCNVNSCRFNNKARACTLSDIIVGQEPQTINARQKTDTVCGSFEADGI